MNRLEQYIGDLKPSCWLNNQHVNGYGVSQPEHGEEITEWKDISGNNHHAISTNHGLFIRNSSGIAKTQNNLPAIQVSNNDDDNTSYKGAEFTISGISQLDNDFTCVAIGSTHPSRFAHAYQIINRFSIYGEQEILRLNQCRGINDNVPIIDSGLNVHNFFYLENYGKYLTSRPLLLNNLLNQVHSLYVVLHTYKDATAEHKLYDQKYFNSKYTLVRPTSLDYTLIPFGNALDPIVTEQPFNKRHGIGQEFIFWNRELTSSELKQVQSYLKQKYNI